MSATILTWQQGYRLNQLPLTVFADDAQLFEIVTAFASVHWLAATPSVETKGGVTLAFHTHATQPALPAIASTQLKIDSGTAYITEPCIFLVVQDAVLVIEAKPAQTIHIYASTHTEAEAIGLLFTQALQAALRRADCFELHAAAAVSPNETGILFIGDSGCGKSTLTVKLAAQGWRYLTDDSLLLRQRKTQLFVSPLRRVFALTPQTLQACGKDVETSMGGKVALEPTDWFPAGHVAQFTPRHLVFPKLTHEPQSALTPLTPASAMMRLLYHSPWASFDSLTSRVHLQRLTQLAQSTRAWELHAGRDLLEIPDAAATRLAELDAQ